MPLLSTFMLMIFLAGVAFGYAVRAAISRRRHVEARRRYGRERRFDTPAAFHFLKLRPGEGALNIEVAC